MLIIRHTETEFNRKMITQGHKDSPLTKSGIEQAEALANSLQNIRNSGIAISCIYSSDLGRCMQVAGIVNSHHHLKISFTRMLRERSFGIMDGKATDEVIAGYPLDDPDFVFPGGESTNMMKQRVLSFIEGIDKDSLLITHDGCVRAVIDEAGMRLDPTFGFIGKIERKDGGKLLLEVLQN